MITECNTQEEYKKRISELRKERDNLRRRANEIDEEMDRLEINSKIIDFTIGKYVIIDRRNKGGYKYYFHVDSWKNEPRGVALYGKGFSVGDSKYIRIEDSAHLCWEDLTIPVEITEEEFIKAFDNEIERIRKILLDFKTYKVQRDAFEFTKALKEGKIKPVWKNDTDSIMDMVSKLAKEKEQEQNEIS